MNSRAINRKKSIYKNVFHVKCMFSGVHWFVMSAWAYFQNTDFCPTRWEERLFNIVVGVIYCFSFFSLKVQNLYFVLT